MTNSFINKQESDGEHVNNTVKHEYVSYIAITL